MCCTTLCLLSFVGIYQNQKNAHGTEAGRLGPGWIVFLLTGRLVGWLGAIPGLGNMRASEQQHRIADGVTFDAFGLGCFSFRLVWSDLVAYASPRRHISKTRLEDAAGTQGKGKARQGASSRLA